MLNQAGSGDFLTNNKVDIHFSVYYYFFKYSWPYVSEPTDSINCEFKIFREEIPESFKKQNLNLPHTKHYAECTQMKGYGGISCCSIYVIRLYTGT